MHDLAAFLETELANVLLEMAGSGFDRLDDAVGVGLRLNLPIGPLRLDYGYPIKDQGYNHSSGKFSFDVGYQF